MEKETLKRNQHKDFKFKALENAIVKNRQREIAVIEKKRKYNPDKDKFFVNLNEVETMRLQLKWFGKLATDEDIDKMIKMQYSIKDMQQMMNVRALLTFIVFIVGTIASFFLKHLQMGMAVTLLLSIGSWFFSANIVSKNYEKYQVERSVAFAEITRLLSAYAPELKYGSNLIALLNRIAPRIEKDVDRSALQQLMLDIQKDPADPQPFLDFAHKFSVSDRAELIMLSVQQMYLGDVDDTSIRALSDDANRDLLKQIDKVIEKKCDKFMFNNQFIAYESMIVVGSFLFLTLVSQFMQIFSYLGK